MACVTGFGQGWIQPIRVWAARAGITSSLVFQFETGFDGYLIGPHFPAIDFAADLRHLEPTQLTDSGASLGDRRLDGLADAFIGRSDKLDDFEYAVSHCFFSGTFILMAATTAPRWSVR